MLVSDFFDDKTESMIDTGLFYGPQKHIVDKCMILFSDDILNYLLNNYECEPIGTLGVCCGNITIYSLTYKNEKIAFYLSYIGSTMAASLCYEAHWITGATKFIMFGSCGSLDGDKTNGKYVIPTEAYRGDGCSHYYAPSSDYLTIKNSDKIASIFADLKLPFVQGKIWTTDSMLRETRGLVAKRQSEGCIAVEMELAGVQAACDFYGLELYDFLEAGDVLSNEDYEIGGLSAANNDYRKALIALEILSRV